MVLVKNNNSLLLGEMHGIVGRAWCYDRSRLTIVSREAKKQAVRDEQVSFLHVASL